MSADWFGEFDSKLLTIDPLLLHSASGEAVNSATFLRNLLAVVAGRRRWLEVTREYLSRAEFEAALRCLDRAPEGGEELLATIRDSWQIWRRRCQEQLAALSAKHEVLRGLQGPESGSSGAAELLHDAKAMLTSIPEEVFDERASALALLKQTPLRIMELPTYLALAEVGLEEESKAIADRERRIRDRLLTLKKEADRLIGDLLLRDNISAANERAINLQQARLNEAIRGKNIALLEQVLSSLQKIASGEVSAEDALPVAPANAAILMEAVPFRREDLSSAALQLLRQTGLRIPEIAPGKDFTAFNPWEWDEVRLERQKAVKINESNIAGNPEAEKALGEVLMAEAKLRLLDRDAFRARILFCDAFRWSCQFPTERAQRDVIVSCILLASAIMFLPTAERPSFDAGSLAKEVQRRVDTHLVGRLDQRELLHEQSAVLVRLGPGAARVYFQNYLRSYLVEHARAANSLLVELVDLADELPGVALSVLCQVLSSLLGELPPSANAKLEEATEAAKALGVKDRNNAELAVRLIRSALLTLIDDYDLAAVVHESLEALTKKLAQPMQSPKSLRQSLITDEVTENANDPRIVVRVTEPGDTRIRYLWSVVYFFDPWGARVKLELDEPPLMTQLPEGESREIDFHLRSVEPELLSTVKTIQVRHTYLDDKAAAQGLQTDHERFSIRFRSVPPTSSPPTPYIVGNAVQDPSGIYGRDDDIEMIWGALTGAKQDNVVLVRGPRRIGKTTLLNALVEHPRFNERYIIAREDLQVKNAADSAIVFRSKLPPVIQARLQHAGIAPPRIHEERFNESSEQGFKEFMLEVDEAVQLAGRRLLIILDELDQLAENPAFGATAVATLREVIMATRRTSFILAGAREVLDRLTLTREDRLFKLGLEVALAPLPADAARSLIQKPARPWYTMSERAVDLIVRETNRQPYLIQCVCHEVFQKATREGLGRVTESYVAEVLLREIIPRERFFVEFKSVAQNDDDYRLLKAMALRQWGNTYVAITELGRDLGMGGESGRRNLRERLQALLSQAPEVVERHGVDRQRYRLKVGLFARHLRYLQEDGRLTG